MKICSKCKVEKSDEEFYKNKKSKDGLRSVCVECKEEYRLSEKGKEVHRRACSKYQKTEKGKKATRRKQLKRKYGITPDDYNKMLIEQNHVCIICGNSEKDKRLAIDHNHKTGRVRALLCQNCNMSLGYIENYIQNPEKWDNYLEVFK